MAGKVAPTKLWVRIFFGVSDAWLAYYCVKIIAMDRVLKWPPPKPSPIYAKVAEFGDKIAKGKDFSSRNEELAFKTLYLREVHEVLEENPRDLINGRQN